MLVRDLMATKVTTIERNDPLSVANDIMKRKRIRHLPVVEGRRLAGILSQHDLFHAALSSTMGFGQKASDELLKSVPVKEAMTDEVITVAPSDDLKKAAQLMIEHKISCLPVLEDGKLVGILAESDFLRLVLEGSQLL